MPIFKKVKEDTWGNILNKALYKITRTSNTPLNQPRNYKTDLIEGYLDNEIIYSIVNKIARKASTIPLVIKNNNGDIIEKHWALDVLHNPNPDMTLQELLYSNYIYLLSIGNSYIYSPFLVSGKRKELWIMPAEEVEIITGHFYEPIKGYKLITGQQEIEFSRDEILHDKLFNPRFNSGQWLYGLSPVAVAAEIIKSYNLGIERLEYSFINGGPDFIISQTEFNALTVEQQQLLEDTYKSKFEGSKNAKKHMLSSVPLQAIKLGSDPIDLSIFDNSKHALRTLCNVYGVPSVLFNDTENSTYNNVSQARKDMYDDAIIPLNEHTAQKLTKFFRLENEYIDFDYSQIEVLQESYYIQLQALNNITFLTDEEKRERLGK